MPLPPAPRKRADQMRLDGSSPSTPSSAASAPEALPNRAASSSDKPRRNISKPALTSTRRSQTKTPPAPQDHGLETAPRFTPKAAKKPSGPRKLFVLDTNVLMHDPMCLFRFEEHDVFLPMVVLEELDNHKKGMTEVARNARQTSRSLDALVSASHENIEQGLSLSGTGHVEVGG